MTTIKLNRAKSLIYQIEELNKVIKQDGMLTIGRANHKITTSLHNEEAQVVVNMLKVKCKALTKEFEGL